MIMSTAPSASRRRCVHTSSRASAHADDQRIFFLGSGTNYNLNSPAGRYWSSLKNTPKAFANSSPGFERSENPGVSTDDELKPCKGFSVYLNFDTQGCRLRSNPGLELANAFGVFQTEVSGWTLPSRNSAVHCMY